MPGGVVQITVRHGNVVRRVEVPVNGTLTADTLGAAFLPPDSLPGVPLALLKEGALGVDAFLAQVLPVAVGTLSEGVAYGLIVGQDNSYVVHEREAQDLQKKVEELEAEVERLRRALEEARTVSKELEQEKEATEVEVKEEVERTTLKGSLGNPYVVRADGKGDAQSIREALELCCEGGHVHVQPGTYTETLQLPDKVHVFGDADAEGNLPWVTGADGDPPLLSRAVGTTIRRLQLRPTENGTVDAAIVTAGDLVVEECNLVGRIHISGGEVHLRRNRIHNSKAGGIFVHGPDVQATVEENDVAHNAHAGFFVSGGANPRVYKNIIHENMQVGVGVSKGGRGIFEDNDVWGNGFSGVQVKEDGDPVVRRNKIRDGQQAGVLVWKRGRGTFEENEISNNAFAGIEVREEGDPVVRGNRLFDGRHVGLLVHMEGRGTFEENEMWNHAKSGILVREQGHPVIYRNRIHDGLGSGILIVKEGKGEYRENEVWNNAEGGVEVYDHANPTVEGNRIHENHENGIFIGASGCGVFAGNDAWANALAGVEVREEGNPVVVGNRIHDNQENGVVVHMGGRGTFSNNDVWANEKSGFGVQNGGSVTARGNRIHDNKLVGITVMEGGSGSFEENDVWGNNEAEICLGGKPCNVVVQRNVIHDGKRSIWFEEDGYAQDAILHENTIFGYNNAS